MQKLPAASGLRKKVQNVFFYDTICLFFLKNKTKQFFKMLQKKDTETISKITKFEEKNEVSGLCRDAVFKF